MGHEKNKSASSGARFADLSVVTDPEVEAAIGTLMSEWRMRKRWQDFPAMARHLHQHILRTFLISGKPPRRETLKAVVPANADEALADLVARDLVFLDMDDGARGEIAGAYPFSSRPTRHAVVIDGQKIAAVCAIDALGAGAMAHRDAQVATACPICESRIDVTVTGYGLVLSAVSPATAVLWAGIEPINGCAATTQCQSMLMFCSERHLQDWCAARTGPLRGFRFTPAEALQAGAAIFRPFLAQRPENPSHS
ncbi:MAG: alkylmercury lyase family protein [Halocynthiibacter sp.]